MPLPSPCFKGNPRVQKIDDGYPLPLSTRKYGSPDGIFVSVKQPSEMSFVAAIYTTMLSSKDQMSYPLKEAVDTVSYFADPSTGQEHIKSFTKFIEVYEPSLTPSEADLENFSQIMHH